jgi:alanyl-tRNA synthetase
MTDHLYYTDSFLYEFEAKVVDVIGSTEAEPRPSVVLDRTAFYPTSGGQVFDTGWISPDDSSDQKARVVEVTETDDGTVRHFLSDAAWVEGGLRVHGAVDAKRRRDHMQQHSGQHVLSAAFVHLFNLQTVSFHMGEDYCSIDLDTKALSREQVEAAEQLANEVVLENRPVNIRFVTQEESRSLGLRKLPPANRGELRLIEVPEFDLSACGGTHVRSTGQIGCILLRKTEKVRQGTRVEFVCGQRAVRTARQDYSSLAEAASLYSVQLWDIPQAIRKAQDEARTARRVREQLEEELAEQLALRILADTPVVNGRKVVVKIYDDRDLSFIKLLGQKLTRSETGVIALLAAMQVQPAVVFVQSQGQPFDMGAFMKQALAKLGGRGGGSKDMAQGGPQQLGELPSVLEQLADKIRNA